jgi:hypothetical protein
MVAAAFPVSILLDFDANGFPCLQRGGLFFTEVETAAIIPVGHGHAGRRITHKGNVEARFVLLAPALAEDLFD